MRRIHHHNPTSNDGIKRAFATHSPSFVVFGHELARSLNGSFGFLSPRKMGLIPCHPFHPYWATPLRLARSVLLLLKLLIRLQLLLHIILDVSGLTRGLTQRVVDILPRRLDRLLHVGFGGAFLAWARVSGASMTVGPNGVDVRREVAGV